MDILDRGTVEGKINHYHEIVSNYENKYSAKYEEFEKNISEANPSTEVVDDLLDWKEAMLMLSVYEKILGELTN